MRGLVESSNSYPIILKTGEFFVIDKSPTQPENSSVMGIFTAFSDLISFHLQKIELLEQSNYAVKNLSLQLTKKLNENWKFRHVSSYALQKPLRKFRVFSGMLVDAIRRKDAGKAQHVALRIKYACGKVFVTDYGLARFSGLQEDKTRFQLTDLEYIIEIVHAE